MLVPISMVWSYVNLCSIPSKEGNCTILHYTILYFTIPCYTIPYYTIQYYTTPYYTIPYYAIPYYATPSSPTILYHTIPCHTILLYTIPCYTIPYYTIQDYTIFCFDSTMTYCTLAFGASANEATCRELSVRPGGEVWALQEAGDDMNATSYALVDASCYNHIVLVFTILTVPFFIDYTNYVSISCGCGRTLGCHRLQILDVNVLLWPKLWLWSWQNLEPGVGTPTLSDLHCFGGLSKP